MTSTIQQLVEGQRKLFQTGSTLPVETRIAALKGMYDWIVAHEDEVADALQADLGKSVQESYMCEIGLVKSEISYMLKHVRSFARRRHAPTPMALQVARSYVQPAPYGNVLILSPWNYPFLLTVDPLVDALAAGNAAIVKPSAYSPASSEVIAKMVGDLFPENYVACVTGGRAENQELLDQKFDLVFFTGSQAVGKVVLEKAAKHLTPAVLELGGKSPVIVDSTAKVPLAARRIVWGKFLNCGQTCVAPDYLLCDERVKDELMAELEKQIRTQLGIAPFGNGEYGRIVNEKHFERLCKLLESGTVAYGGSRDASTLKIEPTILRDVTWDDPVMQEEIFGPILPVLTYSSLGDALEQIAARPRPLAFYLFSEDRATVDRVLETCQFGGGCVNETIVHLATPHMGFGGVGASGMGAYHGKVGFDAFSHDKSVVDKVTWIDMPMRYQPFTNIGDALLRMFVK